jgi:hypothetical protein
LFTLKSTTLYRERKKQCVIVGSSEQQLQTIVSADGG